MKTVLTATAAALVAGAFAGLVVAAGADQSSWGATEWSALASWVTALIAVTAGVVGWRQLGEARRLREEQAQPYVVAFMESNPVSPHIIEMVLRNFGATAAFDVAISSHPVLERAAVGGGSAEPVWLPERWPTLVPGQEWRTLWDSGIERKDSGLPDRHEVRVAFHDSQGRQFESAAVLDWGAYKGRRWTATYGVHHAASALQDLSKTVATMRESIHGGVAVYARDGDAKDVEEQRRAEEWRAERQAAAEATDSTPDSTVDSAAGAVTDTDRLKDR